MEQSMESIWNSSWNPLFYYSPWNPWTGPWNSYGLFHMDSIVIPYHSIPFHSQSPHFSHFSRVWKLVHMESMESIWNRPGTVKYWEMPQWPRWVPRHHPISRSLTMNPWRAAATSPTTSTTTTMTMVTTTTTTTGPPDQTRGNNDEPQPPHHPCQREGNTRRNTGRRGHPRRLDLWCVCLHLPCHPPTKHLGPDDCLLTPSTAKDKAPATSSTTMMALSPPFLLLSLLFHPPLPSSPHLFTYMYYLS